MTVKKFSDLPRFKEENAAELKAMGITTMAELAEALNDEGKFKEIIKNVSGIGPKTAEEWKTVVGSMEETEEDEEVVPIISDSDGISGYTVKLKPELDDEITDSLAKRAIISGRRPVFKRQDWHRYSRLGISWRRPKGTHSSQRRSLKRRPPAVSIGFRGPATARGLHPSGFEEVLVHNENGLDDINPKAQAIRIGSTVGTKKRIVIEDRADELGIRILNRMVE